MNSSVHRHVSLYRDIKSKRGARHEGGLNQRCTCIALKRFLRDASGATAIEYGLIADGRQHDLSCGRPSRRAQERAPQDEVDR
jgi:hypothetical protein